MDNARYNSFFQFVFTILDMLALNMIFIIGLFVMTNNGVFLTSHYLNFFLSWNLMWVVSSVFSYLYISVNYLKHEILIHRTTSSFLLFVLLVVGYSYFYPVSFPYKFVASILIFFGASLFFSRGIFVLATKYLNIQGKFVRRIVIIGYNDAAKHLSDHYFSFSKNVVIEGYFEDYNNVHELSPYPILGNINDCLQYSIDNNISEIYSTLAAIDHPYLYDVAEQAENNFIRFKFVPDFHLYANRDIHIDYIDDIPIISLRTEPLEDIANRIKKRVFDIAFSLCVIVFLLSWLFPILALIIKIDSKGPVFYNQNRLGRDLKKVKVFKFRTMRTMDGDGDFKQATKDDPRVTRVGRILRKTSLDELPQFFNVLFGSMSIVGPRPHPMKMNDDYKRIIDKYIIRHYLKPGITGWAQVNGYRGETKELDDIKGRIQHDIWYMEHWNFWLDIKIIFSTVRNMVKGEKNAY